MSNKWLLRGEKIIRESLALDLQHSNSPQPVCSDQSLLYFFNTGVAFVPENLYWDSGLFIPPSKSCEQSFLPPGLRLCTSCCLDCGILSQWIHNAKYLCVVDRMLLPLTA